MKTQAPKLDKTLLSRRPEPGSLLVSLSALSVLLLVFTMDQHEVLNIGDWFSAKGAQVFGKHEYWRVFTTMFLHADLGHLVANAGFFTGLAFLLSGYFGAWAFPVASFLAGGLINLVTLKAYSPEITLVGISGVVYFMAAFWLTLYVFIQRNKAPLRRVMNAVALSLALLFPEVLDAHVSYLAHAVGFALGVLSAAIYFYLRKDWVRSHEVWRMPEPELSPEPDSDEFMWPNQAQLQFAYDPEQNVVYLLRAGTHPQDGKSQQQCACS